MQNLEYFRELAEWSFKVYLSMEAESEIGVSNSCDLAWSAQMRDVRRVSLCMCDKEGLYVHMIGREIRMIWRGLRRCGMCDVCACVHV